jgi:predicted nucleic acid-binding protein
MMSPTAVILDTTPLGLVTQKAGKSAEADACRAWMENLLVNGIRVYVPEVADYEVRRELIRVGHISSVNRLNNLKVLARYLPITTDVMLVAADLWAKARNTGVVTADIHALDGDVIVAAQALSLGLARSEFAVATKNVKHLSRFVPADLWTNITP